MRWRVVRAAEKSVSEANADAAVANRDGRVRAVQQLTEQPPPTFGLLGGRRHATHDCIHG